MCSTCLLWWRLTKVITEAHSFQNIYWLVPFKLRKLSLSALFGSFSFISCIQTLHMVHNEHGYNNFRVFFWGLIHYLRESLFLPNLMDIRLDHLGLGSYLTFCFCPICFYLLLNNSFWNSPNWTKRSHLSFYLLYLNFVKTVKVQIMFLYQPVNGKSEVIGRTRRDSFLKFIFHLRSVAVLGLRLWHCCFCIVVVLRSIAGSVHGLPLFCSDHVL